MKLFKKILIANRGEIAIRVIRAAKSLGVQAVAIYAKADAEALHVKMADEAYFIGDTELSETYLNIHKIIGVAKAAGCEAIHPGYGFLAENPDFVDACEKAGIVFIGPSVRAIKLMGNKIESRAFVRKIGIPMTEGLTGNIKALMKKAGDIAFPVLIKAAAGGGGKGMRIIYDPESLEENLKNTSREAKSYFGDGTVYIEKFIEDPRHIEIQVLGDNYGNVIHLFERECSIQRRFQKIIEESPSPTLTPEVRMKMGDAAVTIAREIGYSNAGTVEFLVDKDLHFYFLEMNTRIQVEHPVTEMVTGIDIVREQILIAAGKKLDIEQESLRQQGHAIECRIYAEDPENNFMPSPGIMTLYSEPEGNGIRIDTGIETATTIESFYDPMICKLVVWGEDREIAREKMITALNNFIIHGIKTNITYLKHLLKHDAYINNLISTKYCDDHTKDLVEVIRQEKESVPVYLPVIASCLYDFNKWQNNEAETEVNIWQKIGYWRDIMELSVSLDESEHHFNINRAGNGTYHIHFGDKDLAVNLHTISPGFISVTIDDHLYKFHVSDDGMGNGNISYNAFVFNINRSDVLTDHQEILGSLDKKAGAGQGNIVSPMPGKVIKINVKEGEEVKRGDVVIIVEAMKMENHIAAPFDAVVEKIGVKEGDMVDSSISLMVLHSTSSN